MDPIETYRLAGENQKAYDLAKVEYERLKDNPSAKERLHKLVYELTIVSYYINKKHECGEYYDRLWLYHGIKFTKNLQFYLEPLPMISKFRLSNNNIQNYYPCNPSLLPDGDNYWTSIRWVNYIQIDGIYHFPHSTPKIHSILTLFYINKDFQVQALYRVEEDDSRLKNPNSQISGMEDARLFWNDNHLAFSCTVADIVDGRIGIAIGQIAEIKRGQPLPVDRNIKVKLRVCESPGKRGCEKNWLRWQDDTFLYDVSIGQLLNINTNHVNTIDHKVLVDHRGGAGPLPFDDGQLVLVHSHLDQGFVKGRTYIHRFLWYRDKLEKYSRWFYFNNQGVEFAIGMIYKDKDHIIIGYGVDDREDWFGIISVEEIRKMWCV